MNRLQENGTGQRVGIQKRSLDTLSLFELSSFQWVTKCEMQMLQIGHLEGEWRLIRILWRHTARSPQLEGRKILAQDC